MIAVFVREQDTIKLIRRYTASLEAQDELARAQSSIDQNLAMIGCDEGTISGATAAEHGQTEHARYLATAFRFAQIEFARETELNRAVAQSENATLFRIVIERPESANLFEAPHPIQRIKVVGVAGG